MGNIAKISNVITNSIERISSVESTSIVNIVSAFIQDMDNIIIGGNFSSMNAQNPVLNYLARLNTDGSLDTSFNIGTGFNLNVNTIVVLSDGKILVGGFFTTYKGLAQNRIARLNADGSLDTSFNIGAGFGGFINIIVVQSDGKIVVAGNFTTYKSLSQIRIARLNADGSLDTSFNIGTGFGGSINIIALQSDGKILVGGNFTTYKDLAQNYIARLNTDGSLDSSFNIGTGFDSSINTIVLQSDGKVVVGGIFTTYKDLAQIRIARLNTDGSLDTSFNIGTGFDSNVNGLALQSDGKILVAGNFTTYKSLAQIRIARLNTDGSLDSTFDIGTGFGPIPSNVTLQSDGKIIVGGFFTTYKGLAQVGIARLNTDGSLDSTLNIGAGFDNTVNKIVLQSDGKFLVGGNFTTLFTTFVSRLLKINSDNSLDLNFNSDDEFNSNASVKVLLRQSDGKILVVGNFTTYKGLTQNHIARLNVDGSIDSSFDIGTGFGNSVNAIALQSDGKILVGGSFTTYKGLTQNYIARLNTNGSLDTSFNIGTGFNSNVNGLALQSDGKILVGGFFTTYKGLAQIRIARLNTDGSLDTSFNIGTGFGSSISAIALQSDGKIVVGGSFTTYKGLTQNYIARLNTDGSLDSSFDIGTGFNSNINAIALQSDGKILVGGNFTTYKGLAQNRIARLNTDGSLDSSFNIGTGFDSTINGLTLQTNGKILVTGNFTTYKGLAQRRIARININGSLDTAFSISLNTTANNILKY